MRIVSRDEFLKLTPGTIFTTYAPCWFGRPSIKRESIEGRDLNTGAPTGPIDFYYLPLQGEMPGDSDLEMVQNMENMARDSAISLPLEFDVESRDGFYAQSQLFAVWEAADVQTCIVLLLRSIQGEA